MMDRGFLVVKSPMLPATMMDRGLLARQITPAQCAGVDDPSAIAAGISTASYGCLMLIQGFTIFVEVHGISLPLHLSTPWGLFCGVVKSVSSLVKSVSSRAPCHRLQPTLET